MKIIKKLLLLIIVIILMAGCAVKEELKMKISSDKKTEISILSTVDNEMIDAMLSMKENGLNSNNNEGEEKTYTDEERWAYLEGDSNTQVKAPAGYEKIEKYDKDGFKGYLAIKNLDSIDKISSESATTRINILGSDDDCDDEEDDCESESNQTISGVLDGALFIKNGTKYKSNMTANSGDNSTSSYGSYNITYDLKLIVELPVKPISNNATSVSEDGKTLTYDLLKTKDIDFEFELPDVKTNNSGTQVNIINNIMSNGKSNILLYAGIGGGILLLTVVIVICVIISKKKKTSKSVSTSNQVETVTSEPIVQPAVPEPAIQPATPEPVIQPTVPEPAIQPATSEPVIQPATPEPTIQPTVPEPIVQPTVPEPTIQPTVPEPIVQPTVPEPTIQPTVPEPVIQPTVPESAIQPTVPEPVIQPTVPESAIQNESETISIEQASEQDINNN